MVLIVGLLPIAHVNEINFGVANEPDWFPFYFEDSILYDPRALDDPGRSSVLHPAGPMHYRD